VSATAEPLLHELHDAARARGIEGYRRMPKQRLLELLGHDVPGAPAEEPAGPTAVEVSRRGPLGLLTLRGAGNALALDTLESLAGEAERLAEDGSVWLVAITGAGKLFSAGADLESMRGLSGDEVAGRGGDACARIGSLPLPTVALLNGHAVGGGVDLALACDWRIAGQAARLRFIHNQLGYTPPWGAARRLPELVGRPAALRLFALHEVVSAAEARGLGLVDEVAPEPRLLARAESMAARMSRGGREAVVETTRLMRGGSPAGDDRRVFALLWDGRSSTLQA
jgi:enoyl-CoA hydratase